MICESLSCKTFFIAQFAKVYPKSSIFSPRVKVSLIKVTLKLENLKIENLCPSCF